MLSRFSRVQLCATPWTVARQAPLSMGSPGKNPAVGCRALLQGIFLTQGWNLRLLVSCVGRRVLHPQRHLGSPDPRKAYPTDYFKLVCVRVSSTVKKAFENTGLRDQVQVNGTHSLSSCQGPCPPPNPQSLSPGGKLHRC